MHTPPPSPIRRPEFKILCVDGGGFKGLCSAAVLEVIERERGSLSAHFDMLTGTSTGGLIALGLAAGKSAADLVEFYKSWGPKIFSKEHRHGPVLQWFSRGKNKYSDKGLREATEHILGERRIGESNSFLCIPSFNVTESRPRVFKTDHGGIHTGLDSRLLMREVALATASAPTFFPIATVHEDAGPAYYIDGGLWANNPALVALTEACRFFVGPGKPYGSVRILSVSSAAPVPGRLASQNYARSPITFFKGELLEATMEAQGQSTSYFIDFLKGAFCVPVEYTRIPAGTLSDAQCKGIGLDTVTPEATRTLISLGTSAGHEWKAKAETLAFFQTEAPKIGLHSQN